MVNTISSTCKNAYKGVCKVRMVYLYNYTLDFRAMPRVLLEQQCCVPL